MGGGDKDSRGRWYVYNYGWFDLLYSRKQHNIAKQFSSNKKYYQSTIVKRAKEKTCRRNGNLEKLEHRWRNSDWLTKPEEAIEGRSKLISRESRESSELDMLGTKEGRVMHGVENTGVYSKYYKGQVPISIPACQVPCLQSRDRRFILWEGWEGKQKD